MKLKGTITEQNLLKAFAGESQARNRYTFFAQTAKEEGYEQIAGIFAETADQNWPTHVAFSNFSMTAVCCSSMPNIPQDVSGKRKKTCWKQPKANCSNGLTFTVISRPLP